MGVSDLHPAKAPRPRPVWIDSSGLWSHKAGLPPSIGILLEWRRAPDVRGQPSWEGLVIWASSHRPGAWASGCTWMRSGCIRPMKAADWKDEARSAQW